MSDIFIQLISLSYLIWMLLFDTWTPHVGVKLFRQGLVERRQLLVPLRTVCISQFPLS
jgi:hypothetical protein